MIAGLGYNAAKPNARVPETENIDWQDMAQKRANLEKTKVEIANLKKPKEKEGKQKDFSDVFQISAAGAFKPDVDFLNNTKSDIGNFVVENMEAINSGDTQAQMQLSEMLDQYAVMFEQSKETKAKYEELAKKKMEGGYLDLEEPAINVFEDNLTIQSKDAQGNVIPKNVSVKNAKTFEDYQNAYLARQSEFDKPFKEDPIEQQITKNWKLLTDPKVTEVETANGKTRVVTEVTPDEARYRLQNLWNGNRDFQRQAEYDYKQALKNTPDAPVGDTGKTVKEMKDAREFVVESQVPVIARKDVKIEGGSGGYGAGQATSEDWTKNALKGTTLTIGAKKVPSKLNFTVTETPATFTTGEAIDMSTGKKYAGTSTEAVIGQVHSIPIFKDTKLPVTGDDFLKRDNGGSIAAYEYEPVMFAKTDEGDELILPVSVGMGAAESKESKEERQALKERIKWAQEQSDKFNQGLNSKSNKAKTILTKVQSTKDPKKFKVTYTDGTSEIITE